MSTKKLLAIGLTILGILIVVHHWYVKGYPADLSNLFSHEFFASLFLGLGVGGLLFAM